MLARAAASGLMSAGCDVIDVGMVPTPCAQYLVAKSGHLKGAIVVTASHNPREFNGLKAIDAHGMEMRREDEESIEAIFFEDRFHAAAWSDVGSSRSDDTAIPRYMEAIEAKVDAEGIRKRNPMVVVDPGNGAGCVVTPYLLRSLGCRVLTLNAQPDGAFPGRLPEPTPGHLGDLMRVVSEAKMLELLAHEGKSLSALVAALPQYHIKKANVDVPVERREAVLAAIVELAKGRKVDSTDGVKILETDGAVLVRPSGTEPIFRVYAEAKTPARADALAEEGVSWIKRALGHR